MYGIAEVKRQVKTREAAIVAAFYFTAKEEGKTRSFNPLFTRITNISLSFRDYEGTQAALERNKMLTLFNDITTAQQEEIQREFIKRVDEETQLKALNLATDYINASNTQRSEEPQPQPQEEQEQESTFNFGEQEQEPAPTPQPQPTPKTENMTPQPQQQDGMHGMFNFDFIKDFIDGAVKTEIPAIARTMQQDNKAAILEAAQELKPTIININHVETGTVTGKTHKKFELALTILKATNRLYLKGDSGTGKSFLGRQLSEALGIKFGFLALTAGITEGKITGIMLLNGEYVETSFVDVYENGGVFLLDEVDAADSNTLLAINNAIEDGNLPVPNRTKNPTAKMHKNFFLICAANTWGTGNESDYHGREVQDGAFLNRFSASKMVVDYDKELEEEMLKENPKLCKKLQGMRDNCNKYGVQRTISTRTLRDAQKLVLAGLEQDKIINEIICADWTPQEISKVLNN